MSPVLSRTVVEIFTPILTMVLNIFLPLIKRQLRFLRILKYCPLEFDNLTQELSIKCTTSARWSLRLRQTLQWIYLALLFIPVVRLWKRGCYGKSFQGVMVIAVTLALLLCCSYWTPNKKAIQLMNALIKFDQKLIKS